MAVTRMSRSSIRTFDKFRNIAGNLPNFDVRYLVVAGGGAGGSVNNGVSGGGGAGGYLTDTVKAYTLPSSFTVTVGAGGSNTPTSNGANSVFSSFTAIGGGQGRSHYFGTGASIGGSGGGGGTGNATGAAGTSGQGFAGGDELSSTGGGGGGASEAGNTDGLGHGGDGLSSDITGSAVTRAGGGGSSLYASASRPGGDGGGGAGGVNATGVAGTANTGGGGGGVATTSLNGGGVGGSGIVIMRVPTGTDVTVGAGLTYSTATTGSDTVYSFTAGSDTVGLG